MSAKASPSSPEAAVADARQWQAASRTAQAARPELHWLDRLRSAALARVTAAGWPDPRSEDWRYTSLKEFSARSADYLAAVPGAPDASVEPAAREVMDAAFMAIRMQDGQLLEPVTASSPGLQVCSLRHAGAGLRSLALALMDKAAAASDPPVIPSMLVDLNTALLQDVVLVSVAAGAPLTRPLHVSLRSGAGRRLAQPRLLVIVGAGSSLTLVLEHSGEAGALVNAVTQVEVGHAGRLELVRIQDLPDDGLLTESTSLVLAPGAEVRVTSVDLGSRLSRQDLGVTLAGEGASATISGLFLADGHRHIDNHTSLEHRGPRTVSREFFRGIADDHGRGVFNGKILVQPGASGSDAALTNRNLLLTTTAELDTKPELEIYTDDVRCSHGATTGQLDASALFYLRSRGLDAATARHLLTTAFLRQGLELVSDTDLRARLDARLQVRLRGITA